MAGNKKGHADNLSANQAAKPEDKKLATMKEAGRAMKHGLYCDPNRVKVDGRSFFGKLRKSIKKRFLEGFQGTPSPLAQALAEGTAANLILAMNFQAAFLRGDQLPQSILRDYTGLWNSISRDLQALNQMAKESGGKGAIPDLEEFLKQEYPQAVKKARAAVPVVVKVKAEPEPEEEAAATPGNGKEKGIGEKPLF